MCKYCDLREDIHLYGESTDMLGEEICDGKYEGCRIIERGERHYIQLSGSCQLHPPKGGCLNKNI